LLARYGRDVLSGWQGWSAAIVATLLTGLLVILETTDEAMRRWWAGHALTTDTVSGLLVLGITLLVVDQLVRLRQLKGRARAIGAQAAIVMAQATRAAREVSQAVAQGLGPGDRDDAADEFRTYMMMLLVGAPVLIDERASRTFLEQAQAVAGEMAQMLAATSKTSGPAAVSATRLDDALKRLREASTPLFQALDPATRAAVGGDESALPVRRRSHSGKSLRLAATRPARLPPVLGCYSGWGWRGWTAPRRSYGFRRGSASGCCIRLATAATSFGGFQLAQCLRCCAPLHSDRCSPMPPAWTLP
jgi:hypothetical protein